MAFLMVWEWLFSSDPVCLFHSALIVIICCERFSVDMKEKRIELISDYVKKKTFVTNEELCSQFDISMSTLRRDLGILQNEGIIEKVYGGVKSSISPPIETVSEHNLSPFSVRNEINREAKSVIAERAASFIEEEDVIFIDTGTSTVHILPYLAGFRHLTIITNSVYILYYCLNYPQITTMILPGELFCKSGGIIGVECLTALEDYTINKSFMACTGLTIENGIVNSSPGEISIKRKALERSNRHFLLADSSKFNKSAMLSVAPLTDFDVIITEKEPEQSFLSFFSKNHIQCLVAKRSAS